jgi:hypothetical protein
VKKQLIAMGLALPVAAVGLVTANHASPAAAATEISPAALVSGAAHAKSQIVIKVDVEYQKSAFDTSSVMQDKPASDLTKTLDQ